MKNILITGVAGFIGSNLAEALLATNNYFIVGLDNFDTFYDRKIKESNLSTIIQNPNFNFIELSINDHDLSKHLSSWKFDLIIHLAAKAGVRPSIDSVESYYQANVMGTLNLYEFAKGQQINHIIFGSSSSVYGQNRNTPWQESDTNLLPISPYAVSKLSGEFTARIYSHLNQISTTCLRFFTVYGPRQRPDLAIHKFVSKIENGEAIQVFGDGSTFRDYTYVGDIVSGIRKAMEYESSGFEIFNLASGRKILLREVISELEIALNKKALIEWMPTQAGDVNATFADISKAKEVLGYQPAYTFEQGIKEFVNWKRNQ